MRGATPPILQGVSICPKGSTIAQMNEATESNVVRPPEGSIIDTRYWHVLEDGRVQCDVCPRACKLHDGQRGLCFVRGAEAGRIKLFSYGRSSGFCVDPIEKKPLNHFLPGTSVLSFGTAGCNLACKNCQNWGMSKSREMDTLADSASPEDLAEAAERLGCASIAFTYNDPVVFMEYAMDAADACRARGIKSVAVTAGYICAEPRAEFYRHMDAANVDLKAFTERFYYKICGGALAPVLETLEYLKASSVWFEITTLLIPGENDSDAELDQLTQWVAEKLGPNLPLHFTAFHPDWKMRDKPCTPAATLTRARRIALANGLQYVYTGNVHDRKGGSTYCPQCGTCVIERDWYELGSWQLTDIGACRKCGTQIPGVFAGKPGAWGARRLGVRLAAHAAGPSK
jgi:pyruvate formate lyase activating enzyme